MTISPRYFQFASDNYAGICPEAWQALAEANAGYAISYGDDPWTAQACDALRAFFATDGEIFFVFTGTAAITKVMFTDGATRPIQLSCAVLSLTFGTPSRSSSGIVGAISDSVVPSLGATL